MSCGGSKADNPNAATISWAVAQCPDVTVEQGRAAFHGLVRDERARLAAAGPTGPAGTRTAVTAQAEAHARGRILAELHAQAAAPGPADFGIAVRPDEGVYEGTEQAGTMMLPPDARLVTAQKFLAPQVLQHYRDNPGSRGAPGSPGRGARPFVVLHKGEYWIDDGTHRLAVAREQGRTIKVGWATTGQ